MTERRRILIFVGCYLPGFRGGGPIRSIANIVEALGDEANFTIVTRDRDLGSSVPFDLPPSVRWHTVGKARVHYLKPGMAALLQIRELIREARPDTLYLNSFFDTLSGILPLLALRTLKGFSPRVVLAPRGEFSGGALELKALKKRVFLWFAKFFHLHADAIFQPSSEHEAQDIARNVPSVRQELVNNIGPLGGPIPNSSGGIDNGPLRVVFVARVAAMKNPDLAIEAVKLCRHPVIFDLFGPKEDVALWERCSELMSSSPHHIVITYRGELNSHDVLTTLATYDLLLMPTRGENFGHSIAEAFAVGTPVLISDRTPWRDLERHGVGWDLRLAEGSRGFALRIDELAATPHAQRAAQRRHIVAKAVELSGVLEAIEQTRTSLGLPSVLPQQYKSRNFQSVELR